MLFNTKLKYSITIWMPLLYCVFIAVFYRTEHANLGYYFGINYNLSTYVKLNNILIYSLPEALWVFSLTLLIGNKKLFTIPLFILPIAYCLVLEVLQYYSITNGTFDILDIILPIFLWGIAILSISKNRFYFNKVNFSLYRVIITSIIFCSVYLVDVA